MELYVIRHAIAEPLGKGNQFSDEKRALTEEGRNRMREAVKGLRKLGVELDLIMTSPLVRAVETAEILAGSMGISRKEIQHTPALAPGALAEQLFAEIKSHGGAESIALVGHQPDLGSLISRIIQSDHGVLSIQLKKGSIGCINVTETVPTLRGALMWLLTSRQLRMLA
ncbi:MAG: phosphohistidine phosphatase SixA [Acidobacteriota bacterium]